MKADDARSGHTADEFRTSSQYSLRPSQTDELLHLSRRVQLLTRIPVMNTEQIQVQTPIYMPAHVCARPHTHVQ